MQNWRKLWSIYLPKKNGDDLELKIDKDNLPEHIAIIMDIMVDGQRKKLPDNTQVDSSIKNVEADRIVLNMNYMPFHWELETSTE